MAKRKQVATEKASKPRSDRRGSEPGRHGTEAGAIAGEVAGAVVGSGAGPVGTVAGMIIGGVAGALTGKVLEDEQRRAEVNDAALDRIIGVIGGDMGVPTPVPASPGQFPGASTAPGSEPLASGAAEAISTGEGSPSGGTPRPFVADLLELIELRQSSRGPFDSHRAISPEHLGQILEAARWAPTAHNMQNFDIVVVDDRALLEALSNVHTETSRTFIEENYAQLSFSEAELKKRKTGLLASAFPPSWWTRGVTAQIEEAHAHSILGAPIKASAAVIIVVFDPRKRAPASEGDVLGMMSLGCVMQNMWLAAQALGIGFQVQSVFGAEGVEPEVKRLLAIPDPLRVAFAARLGYPPGPQKYVRVRRDIGDFAHDNGFGKPWRRSTGR